MGLNKAPHGRRRGWAVPALQVPAPSAGEQGVPAPTPRNAVKYRASLQARKPSSLPPAQRPRRRR